MQQPTLSRLQRSSGIIAVILKVAAIIMIVYGALYLAALIAYRTGGDLLRIGSTSIHIGPGETGSVGIIGGADGPTAMYVTARLAIPFIGTIDLAGWVQSVIFSVQIVQLVILIIALFTASGVFRLIQRSHTPFLPEVPRRMKRIAIFLLIISLTGISVIDSLSLGLMPVNQPIALLAAGLCYCFALIFDYGCRLQKQDDETL